MEKLNLYKIIVYFTIVFSINIGVASNTFAATKTCQTANADLDGDGWGWENNASCKVEKSSVEVSAPEVTPVKDSTPVVTETKTTIAECINIINGWGWDPVGLKSCKESDIQTNEPTEETTVPNTETEREPSSVSTTEANCINVDKNGWGWDPVGLKSCKESDIQTNEPTEETTVQNTETEAEREPSSVPTTEVNCINVDKNGWGWNPDKLESCKVDVEIKAKEIVEETQVVETTGDKVGSIDDIIFKQDFENSEVGTYGVAELQKDFGKVRWHQGFYTGQGTTGYFVGATTISKQGGSEGKSLKVVYKGNEVGSGAGAQFPMEISGDHEELYISYKVKFSSNFQFVRGGKLPGLCGYNNLLEAKTGCKTGGGIPTADEGWSGRLMWREDGAAETYLYSPSQSYNYGESLFWGVNFQRDKWHKVEQRIKLNSVGLNDGVIEVWMDGVKVYGKYNLEIRKKKEVKINTFYFSTFFGGADQSWAPSSDQTAYFDEFVISKSKID